MLHEIETQNQHKSQLRAQDLRNLITEQISNSAQDK